MPIISTTRPTSLPPSGTASGDLSGTYPSPTVAKVNGVAVTGTPSLGQVPTATGATAATWQTPGGSSPLTVQVTNLSAAQILALNTVPIEVVAAPGAGKMIYPVFLLASLTYNGVAYADNVEFQIKYAGTSTLALDAFVLLAITANTIYADSLEESLNGSTAPAADVNNKALVATVATGNPTAGTGTVRVTIGYATVDL